MLKRIEIKYLLKHRCTINTHGMPSVCYVYLSGMQRLGFGLAPTKQLFVINILIISLFIHYSISRTKPDNLNRNTDLFHDTKSLWRRMPDVYPCVPNKNISTIWTQNAAHHNSRGQLPLSVRYHPRRGRTRQICHFRPLWKLMWTERQYTEKGTTISLDMPRMRRRTSYVRFTYANSMDVRYPGSKVHGANMGPTCGRQDPGGPHVDPMKLLFGNISASLMTTEMA